MKAKIFVILVLLCLTATCSCGQEGGAWDCGDCRVVYNSYYKKLGVYGKRGVYAMADYASADECPWKDIKDQVEIIHIDDETVTYVGSFAFSDCDKATEAVIGNGVTSIGNMAFGYCVGLKTVVIGSGVT